MQHSPPRKSKQGNRLSTIESSSLDESVKHLLRFAQSEYGLDSINQNYIEAGDKSTEEMIEIIRKKLSDFQDSVKKEQIVMNELKKECRFLQEANQSAKRLKQKNLGQDYMAVLTAEATNEFFANRLQKIKDEYESIQNQIIARREMQEIIQQKTEMEKELEKKRRLIVNLEKSVGLDEKSLENQLKKYKFVREKDVAIKAELEALKSEIKELRMQKKDLESESKEIEDFNLKEKFRAFLVQNSNSLETYEQELLIVLERISKIKEKINQTEFEISKFEKEIMEKKSEKVKIIENYIAVTNKFDVFQKPKDSI